MAEENSRKRNILARFFIWYFTQWYAALQVFFLALLALITVNTIILTVPDLRMFFSGISRSFEKTAMINLSFLGFFAAGIIVSALTMIYRELAQKKILRAVMHFVFALLSIIVMGNLGFLCVKMIARTSISLDRSVGAATPDLYERDNRWNTDQNEKESVVNVTAMKKWVYPEVSEEVRPVNAFAFDSLRMFAKRYPNDNLVYSPVGQYGILGLFYLVSSDKTKAELANVLHWQKDDDAMKSFLKTYYAKNDSSTGSMVKSAGFQSGAMIRMRRNVTIAPEYCDMINEVKFDFRELPSDSGKKDVVREINQWSAKMSNNRMKKLLDSNNIDSDACCFAACVSCFQGGWQYKVFMSMKAELTPFPEWRTLCTWVLVWTIRPFVILTTHSFTLFGKWRQAEFFLSDVSGPSESSLFTSSFLSRNS